MKKYFLSLLVIVILSFNLNAQDKGYKIKVKIEDYKANSLLFATYYGNSNKIVDTAYASSPGVFEFKSDEALVGGIYLFVLENKQYFEVLLDKDQHFSLETKSSDLVGSMKINGSQDNTDFYNLMFYMSNIQKKRSPLELEYKKDSLSSTRKSEIEAEIATLGKEADDYKIKYMDENPDAIFTIILKASREPEIPKVLPKNAEGEPDSTYIYKYFRAHFFDDFDFADERLLHTRFYATKIKKYWTKIIPQIPDTLTYEAIRIIESSKKNKETYKFNIWYFTYAAETSNIMGMDAVFVPLGKKYYLSGEAYWVSPQIVENMRERIETLDRILIGKTAPNMIMQDTKFQLVSLSDIEANYTIVLFWDPDCGHCKHEIPALKKWTDENGKKFGVEVFSVCSDTSVVKWTKTIADFKIESWVNVDGPRSITPNYHDAYDIISTPTIFLLDDKKIILAKRLTQEQVQSFIERDFKNNKGVKKTD